MATYMVSVTIDGHIDGGFANFAVICCLLWMACLQLQARSFLNRDGD